MNPPGDASTRPVPSFEDAGAGVEGENLSSDTFRCLFFSFTPAQFVSMILLLKTVNSVTVEVNQMKLFAANTDQSTREREIEEKATQDYYGRAFEPVFKKIMKAVPASRREQPAPAPKKPSA
jgi:hypothetical protein